jgi:hypothetical protein
MNTNNPCPQCPWRTANQGKRHFGKFYTKVNLTRLWNQIRKGGGQQTCHLTDPSHPDHVKAGAPESAEVRECPGSVVLVIRELELMATMGNEPGNITPEALDEYGRRRKKGLSKMGIMYWLVSRVQMGGQPIFGGPKLPEVNTEDKDIDLPAYLKE